MIYYAARQKESAIRLHLKFSQCTVYKCFFVLVLLLLDRLLPNRDMVAVALNERN